MYITFTKAKKHLRVLSHKEIFYSHRYFTLNIVILLISFLHVIVCIIG